MREDRLILAKLKIDFLTQEMKDRETERETGGERERKGRRAYLFNHAHSQSWLNVHSFNVEMEIKWRRTEKSEMASLTERDRMRRRDSMTDRKRERAREERRG